MSDILVHDRDDNIHIVDYCGVGGSKYALCGVVYLKKDILTTLAVDDVFPGICRKCYDLFTQMYQSDLNEEPQTARGKLLDRVKERYTHIQDKVWDTEHKYDQVTDEKYWYKLNHYRRRSQRK